VLFVGLFEYKRQYEIGHARVAWENRPGERLAATD
jgi:hypothetical protein